MCATSLLTISFLAAAQSQLSALALTVASEETRVVTRDLESAMESILGLSVDEVLVAGGEFAAGQPISRFNDLHFRGQRLIATYPGYVAGTPMPMVLTILVTATWTDAKGRPRRAAVRSAKMR